MHENAWARSVMLSFAILNVFHYSKSTRNTFLPNSTNTCRARAARVHYLFSHPPFRMESFVHGKVCLFSLIDRLVCRIKSNQTLDALIKYVAYYHIL